MPKRLRPRTHVVTQSLAFLVLLIGAAVALYPFYVGALNDVIDNYNAAKVEQANQAHAKKALAEMKKANAKRTKEGLNANADPFSGLTKTSKAQMKKAMIGDVTVPGLKLTVPLFDLLSEQTLAVGAAYLAKEKAIVQKLTAIESLAVSSPPSS